MQDGLTENADIHNLDEDDDVHGAQTIQIAGASITCADSLSLDTNVDHHDHDHISNTSESDVHIPPAFLTKTERNIERSSGITFNLAACSVKPNGVLSSSRLHEMTDSL